MCCKEKRNIYSKVLNQKPNGFVGAKEIVSYGIVRMYKELEMGAYWLEKDWP